MAKMGRKVRPGRKHRIEGGGVSDAPEPPIILTYDNALSTQQYRFFDREAGGETFDYYMNTVTTCDIVDGSPNPSDTITLQRKGGETGKFFDVMRGLLEIPLPDIVMLAGSVFMKVQTVDDYFNQAVCICNYVGGAAHTTAHWQKGVGMPDIPATLLSDTTFDLTSVSVDDWLEFPLNADGLVELQAAQNDTFRLAIQTVDMANATEPSVWTENQMKFHIRRPGDAENVRPYVRYGYVA